MNKEIGELREEIKRLREMQDNILGACMLSASSHVEEVKKRVVVKTVVHLKDVKGWEKEQVIDGMFENEIFWVPRYLRPEESMIAKFDESQETDINSLRILDYRFVLYKYDYEKISGKYYIKHCYYEEKNG